MSVSLVPPNSIIKPTYLYTPSTGGYLYYIAKFFKSNLFFNLKRPAEDSHSAGLLLFIIPGI